MNTLKPKVIRCAIYTRKSSEEGLEQDFNSLHAQREACEAYIKSQAHEGWQLVPTRYEDGGFSGGNLERPALQALMKEIDAGKIQVIVVYKVDRLTRSLADFARIVERLDQRGASFVSITQQFNTTTSMGRLTLNVLLSFAQFEREVTGERIRDKIAASKKKGLWMGGQIPLGYRPEGRTLKIVPEEAEVVRRLYRRYLELKSVYDLTEELVAEGFKTKVWTSHRGTTRGGCRPYRGAIHHVLRNPLYVGKISHRGTVYPGQHEAIVDETLWHEVQRYLTAGARQNRGLPRTNTEFTLTGKLFDNLGNRMTPTFSNKRSGGRYRFYASQAVVRKRNKEGVEVTRIAAETIERFVKEATEKSKNKKPLQRVELGRNQVRLHFGNKDGDESDPADFLALDVTLVSTKHEPEIKLIGEPTGRPNSALIRAVVKAWAWREKLESGEFKSMEALARGLKEHPTYVTGFIGLAFLSPAVTEAILNGNAPAKFTLTNFRRDSPPISWRG